MIIKIGDNSERMLKEIAEMKGGDVAFNEIVEQFIEFMYKAMKIGKKYK